MHNKMKLRFLLAATSVVVLAIFAGCGVLNGGIGAPSVPELVFGSDISEPPVCFASELEDGCICEGEDCVCGEFDCGCIEGDDAECACYENDDAYFAGTTIECFDAEDVE